MQCGGQVPDIENSAGRRSFLPVLRQAVHLKLGHSGPEFVASRPSRTSCNLRQTSTNDALLLTPFQSFVLDLDVRSFLSGMVSRRHSLVVTTPPSLAGTFEPA